MELQLNLSVRTMTYIAVFLFKKYCSKNNIKNIDIDIFCSNMLNILDTEDICRWDEKLREIEITGLGDELPKKISIDYPKYFETIDKITQNIREISAVIMYGAWQPEESYKYLKKVETLTEIKLNTLKSIPLLKKHNPTHTGFGDSIDKETINEWLELDNRR